MRKAKEKETKAKEKGKAPRRAAGYAKALITHLNAQRANQRAKAKQLQPTGWQKTQVGNLGVNHRSRSDSCLDSQWSQETCNKYNYHQKGSHCEIDSKTWNPQKRNSGMLTSLMGT